MATYLDGILEFHRRRAAADGRSFTDLELARREAPQSRSFLDALRDVAVAPAVIAEVKRRSPSRGDLAVDLDPALLAAAYQRGGATCLSVLTDEAHFGGSPEDLVRARDAVSLPVLRKDFTVSVRDLYDARIMGADAALLIVAALSDTELKDLLSIASSIGLDALVEVHDEAELERALEAGALLVGVNQRDLHSFEVDGERAVRVGKAMPEGIVRVAESGIKASSDVERLRDAGFHAILVGEALVTAADPAKALANLLAREGR